MYEHNLQNQFPLESLQDYRELYGQKRYAWKFLSLYPTHRRVILPENNSKQDGSYLPAIFHVQTIYPEASSNSRPVAHHPAFYHSVMPIPNSTLIPGFEEEMLIRHQQEEK